MITLVHGDNIPAIRTALTAIRSKSDPENIRIFDARTYDPARLTQSLESDSLISQTKLVILDNILSGLKPRSKNLNQILEIIARNSQNNEIVICENREMPSGTVKALGVNIRIQLLKTPRVIFQFLDSLRPGSAMPALRSLNQVLSADAGELVFAVLTTRVRQLIMVKDGQTPDKVQSWQAGKLTSQAGFFTMDKLLTMHQKLLEIDYAIKSGSALYDYKFALKQFLLDL